MSMNEKRIGDRGFVWSDDPKSPTDLNVGRLKIVAIHNFAKLAIVMKKHGFRRKSTSKELLAEIKSLPLPFNFDGQIMPMEYIDGFIQEVGDAAHVEKEQVTEMDTVDLMRLFFHFPEMAKREER